MSNAIRQSNTRLFQIVYKPILYCILFMFVTLVYATEPALPKGLMRIVKRPAPELILKDMDGKTFDLRAQQGRWVFVHFWATWCGPCRREMPTIQKLSEMLSAEYGTAENNIADKIRIVLVNTAEDDDRVFSFLGIVAPDLNPLMDYDGLVTERWQPRGIPSTFLVDPQGIIRYLALGGRNWVDPQYLGFIKQLISNQ